MTIILLTKIICLILRHDWASADFGSVNDYLFCLRCGEKK